VYLAATTHTAAAILKSTLPSHHVKSCLTAHKLFGVKPSFNLINGQEKLITANQPLFSSNGVVIIDESSMINDGFLYAISNIVSKYTLKVLFVGDYFQLPPVKGQCSIFDTTLPTFHLTTVHRQLAGNPIVKKALDYVDFISGKTTVEPSIDTLLDSNGKGIHVLTHQKFIEKFVDKYMNFKAGDKVPVPMCTYTNAAAINYNNMIRKATYLLSGTTQEYYENEEFISNTSVINEQGKVILDNNEKINIISYRPHEYEGMHGYKLLVKRSNTLDSVEIFTPNNLSTLNTVLKGLKETAVKNKSWATYYRVKNYVADIRLPFAGTIHKAQGATFDEIFIDYSNILKCKQVTIRNRLMYVALTRAKTNVYISQ
jgi:exodeoxyribonuclease-5